MNLGLGLGLGARAGRPAQPGTLPPIDDNPPGDHVGHEIPPQVEVVGGNVVIGGKTKAGFEARFIVPLGALAVNKAYNVNIVADFSRLALGGSKAGVGFGFKTDNSFRMALLQGTGGTITRVTTVRGQQPNGWNKSTGHTVTDGGAPENGTQHAADIQLIIDGEGDAYDFSTSGDSQETWDSELADQPLAPFATIANVGQFGIAARFSADDSGHYTITVTWTEEDAGAVAETVFGPHTFTSGDPGWAGFTLVDIISAANLAAFGAGTGTHVRLTVEWTVLSAGATMTGLYWGEQASGAGNELDFNGNQVQILFNGSGTITGDGGTLVYVSDWCALGENYDESVNHIWSAQFVGGTHTLARLLNGSNGDALLFKGGADAATTDKSGYSNHLTNTALFVSKIEIANGIP